MSRTADGQDGNGLHLEKIGQLFQVYRRIMVYFLFENSPSIFLQVLYKHFVYGKVLSFNLGAVLIQKRRSPYDIITVVST